MQIAHTHTMWPKYTYTYAMSVNGFYGFMDHFFPMHRHVLGIFLNVNLNNIEIC